MTMTLYRVVARGAGANDVSVRYLYARDIITLFRVIDLEGDIVRRSGKRSTTNLTIIAEGAAKMEANALTAMRERAGYSAVGFAEKARIGATTVARIEANDPTIGAHVKYKYAKALGISRDHLLALLGNNEDEEKEQ